MVIIKTMDKSTLKSKINYQSNYQSDINTDLSNISNPNNEWNKVRWYVSTLTYDKSLKIICKPTKSIDMFK